MRVTMKEIAERAGVHQATVDKVVHNRVGVSDEVRARVQAIIDELGYKPSKPYQPCCAVSGQEIPYLRHSGGR